jgi:hypothetical protein
MAEQALTYALTTTQRIKDRLLITVSSHDTEITRLVNAVTDWIEGYCGRRFKESTYTQEVYSVNGSQMRFLMLKQAPVSTLSTLEYAAGTPSNKSWTAFTTDEYELRGNGSDGIVRVYSTLPYGTNTLRATYTAGYKINFTNYGDNSTHTLPADITELAERMIVKTWKRRDNHGKTSESFQGASVSWATALDDEDRHTLDRYKRMPQFV